MEISMTNQRNVIQFLNRFRNEGLGIHYDLLEFINWDKTVVDNCLLNSNLKAADVSGLTYLLFLVKMNGIVEDFKSFLDDQIQYYAEYFEEDKNNLDEYFDNIQVRVQNAVADSFYGAEEELAEFCKVQGITCHTLRDRISLTIPVDNSVSLELRISVSIRGTIWNLSFESRIVLNNYGFVSRCVRWSNDESEPTFSGSICADKIVSDIMAIVKDVIGVEVTDDYESFKQKFCYYLLDKLLFDIADENAVPDFLKYLEIGGLNEILEHYTIH